MDRLLVMRSFVTETKVSSFSGASTLLGASGSLISRYVPDLEKQLGVKLVNRTARSISLAEPGVRFGEFAQRILDEIEDEDTNSSELHDRAEGRLSAISP